MSAPTDRIQELLGARRFVNEEIRKFVRTVCRAHDPNLTSNFLMVSAGWSWECAKSPLGVCVYDELDDPHRVRCIFCGEPEERK